MAGSIRSLQRDRAGIEQRLADQGIRYGSQAYASAMDDYNRQSTDARLAVTAQGGQEQQRMMDMAAQRAGFQNAAQQQAYQQAQGRGASPTRPRSAIPAEPGPGSFENPAWRSNWRSSNPASTPQQAAAQPIHAGGLSAAQPAAQRDLRADERFAGAAAELAQHATVADRHHRHRRPDQSEFCPAAGQLSDRQPELAAADGRRPRSRRRRDEAVGRAREKGHRSDGHGVLGQRVRDVDHDELPIYEYSYKDDPTGARHIGPMAQDVEKIDPKAVHNIGGRKAIDTSRVMGNILRAA